MDLSKIAAETNPGFAQRTAEVMGARVWVEGDPFVVERLDRVEKLRCHGLQGSVQDGVAAAASDLRASSRCSPISDSSASSLSVFGVRTCGSFNCR